MNLVLRRRNWQLILKWLSAPSILIARDFYQNHATFFIITFLLPRKQPHFYEKRGYYNFLRLSIAGGQNLVCQISIFTMWFSVSSMILTALITLVFIPVACSAINLIVPLTIKPYPYYGTYHVTSVFIIVKPGISGLIIILFIFPTSSSLLNPCLFILLYNYKCFA